MISRLQRIVILGGGFAGVYAARHLETLFRRNPAVEITLISEENFLLFTPMLPEIPSSSIEPAHIVSPIRAFFRKVKFHNGSALSIDADNRTVRAAHCMECGEYDLKFDHLVLALGSKTRFHGVPGAAEHALPMKTLDDAMRLRNHVIGLFEHADLQTDPAIRRSMLTFVVAGGGFAGTETAAELNDFAYTARRFYPNICGEDVRVILVNGQDRIMPEISERLATYALGKLERKGVEVCLSTRVRRVTGNEIELSTGERIAAQTLIWTAGVKPSPLPASLPCRRNERGQIMVDPYLNVPGYPRIWALGDCAAIPDPHTGRLYSSTAQNAVRQARLVAENIARSMRRSPLEAFRYRPVAMLAALGRRSAVAEIGRVRFSGFFAWWLWRTVYLLKLPGLERKIRVAVDWTLDLFFPRDTVLLKTPLKRPPDAENRRTQTNFPAKRASPATAGANGRTGRAGG